MPEIVLTLIKYLFHKSVGQLMVTLVLFFLLLILMPENVSSLISEHADFPYAIQILSFAVAYLMVLSAKATGLLFRMFFMEVIPLLRYGSRVKGMHKTLDSLSTEQLLLLDKFLKTHTDSFWADRDNPHANKLVQCGIIRPVASGVGGVSVYFRIDPEYAALMLATWNPCTKHFDLPFQRKSG
ncbi:hypothetical protein DLB77_19420 [Salmonella bongori]|nr:hypothetical protein [Salmonella bongori]